MTAPQRNWEEALIARYPALFRAVFENPAHFSVGGGARVREGWKDVIEAVCQVLAPCEHVYFTGISVRDGFLNIHAADRGRGADFSSGVQGGAAVLAGFVCELCGQEGTLRRSDSGEAVRCENHAPEGAESVPWHVRWLLPPLDGMIGKEDAERIRRFPQRARRAAILVESTVYARRNRAVYDPSCASILGVELDEHGLPVFEFDPDDDLGVELYVRGVLALARAYAGIRQ